MCDACDACDACDTCDACDACDARDACDACDACDELEADPAAEVASTVVRSEPIEAEGPEHREEVVHV